MNTGLEDISGLKNLKYLGGLVIYDSKITSTNVFSNLENHKLDFLGFDKCLFLKDLSGFENIDSINGRLLFSNNASLENIDGLINLRYVKGDIRIINNPLLVDCCIISPFFKSPNDNQFSIVSGNGENCNPVYLFNSCDIVEQTFCEGIDIDESSGLTITNLNAPIQIVKVFDANYATIYECFAECEETITLTDLIAGTYHININLYDENWQPICERIETVQVEANTQDRSTQLLPTDFALYPNPAESETFIDLNKIKGESVQLALFNQFGQKVKQQIVEKVTAQKEKVDISTLQNGVYILQIKAEGKRPIAKKLMVTRLY